VFSRDPTVSDEIVLAMGRKAERVPGTTANRMDPVADTRPPTTADNVADRPT